MTDLSPMQQKLLEEAKAFAQEVPALLAEDIGKVERAGRLFEAYARKGYHALLIPQQYGGRGLDYLSAGIVYELLSHELPGTLYGPLTTVHCAEMIGDACKNTIHKKYLSAIARDHAPAGFCLTEESAGSDITSITTTAQKKGDHYLISGTKSIVINHAIARIFIVFAAREKAKGRASLNAFVVDADLPGISVGEPYDTLGCSHGVMGSVSFDNVLIPAECLLGEEGSGYLLFMETLDKGRPLVAANCVGEAGLALDLILTHTKDHIQFGKPLSAFQGVTFTLSDLATRLHAARLLYQDALMRIDAGKPFTMEASMSKLFASETLMDVASFGMEMLGQKAIAGQNEITRIYHDARLMKAIDGTANVQRMVIASQL
ncbi:MAG: acyl-CoA dehydrogenase family protein [Desulfomonilia bacterium]